MQPALWGSDAVSTTSRVQATVTALALEVLSLLVIDEDLEVVEVALAVVTPWPGEKLLDGGVLALLAHTEETGGEKLYVCSRVRLNCDRRRFQAIYEDDISDDSARGVLACFPLGLALSK
jgi:hypothetical protein